MSADFEDYLSRVRQDAPGCPESVMIDAVRDAAIELCERAHIWRETLAAINTIIGTDRYTLTPATANTNVVLPVSVLYKDKPLEGKSEEELDATDYGWRTADNGQPTAFINDPGGILWLNRKPEEAITGGLVVRVSLKPTQTATAAADFLYQDHLEAIAHGAKRRLMETVGKKWSNADGSRFHGAKFNYYVAQAHAKATKGGNRKSTYVRMRAW